MNFKFQKILLKSRTFSMLCGFFLILYCIFLINSLSHSSKSGQTSSLSYEINDILDSLEDEHASVQRVLAQIEILIDHAVTMMSSGENKSNGDLLNIQNALIETQSSLRKVVDSSIKQSLDLGNTNTALESNQDIGKEIPIPNIISSKLSESNNGASILVVGGTDGSGTRRVVQILTDLGVTMVSEDPETYDIHADLVSGWPPVVKPVIDATHKLNYQVSDLPHDIYESTLSKVKQLLNQVDLDSVKPTSYTLAVGGVLPKPKGVSASGVKYGFKAPVSMTLVPMWAEALQNFKFLHVVRDGRDIAFSANQGPVEKFYESMYGQKNEISNLKSIRLWSDWNSDILKWSQSYAESLSSTTNEKSFGYFMLHSEDLVSEVLTVRFAAIYYLSKWVGSSLSDDEICCLASKSSEFLGSHDRTQRQQGHENLVSKRYGKWKTRVQKSPDLEKQLNEIGKDGLNLFGYEPLRQSPNSLDYISSTGYVCNSQRVDSICKQSNDGNDIEAELTKAIIKSDDPLNKYNFQNRCRLYRHADFKGGDISDLYLTTNSKNCCKQCKATAGCKHFTIDTTEKMCYLKTSRGNVAMDELKMQHLVSGDLL